MPASASSQQVPEPDAGHVAAPADQQAAADQKGRRSTGGVAAAAAAPGDPATTARKAELAALAAKRQSEFAEWREQQLLKQQARGTASREEAAAGRPEWPSL
jgi:hypothetical protein